MKSRLIILALFLAAIAVGIGVALYHKAPPKIVCNPQLKLEWDETLHSCMPIPVTHKIKTTTSTKKSIAKKPKKSSSSSSLTPIIKGSGFCCLQPGSSCLAGFTRENCALRGGKVFYESDAAACESACRSFP